jgi:hypothetical protein
VGGAAEVADGGVRVGMEHFEEAIELIFAGVFAEEGGVSDLGGECGGVVAVAAVGQEGGVDAPVDEVLGGG